MISFRHLSHVLLVSLLCIGLAGCGSSGSSVDYDVADIARFTLPFDQKLDIHPDSLQDVAVVEKENKIAVETDIDFRELVRKWSSARRNIAARSSRRLVNDYATFWGMDPSVLSLQVEMGISGLTRDRALELVEKRKQEVRKEIQIDVFLFAPPTNSRITGPTTRAELVIGTERYKPSRSDYGPVRDSVLPSGQRVLYRRNTFFFKRVRDDADILADASTMSLEVNRFAQGTDDSFTWSWETEAPSDDDRDSRASSTDRRE